MILRKEIPQELKERFLELFGKPLETYWDPFWGWERSNGLKQFELDFPNLSPNQFSVISSLVRVEEDQFQEARKEASVILTSQQYRSYGRKMADNLKRQY